MHPVVPQPGTQVNLPPAVQSSTTAASSNLPAVVHSSTTTRSSHPPAVIHSSTTAASSHPAPVISCEKVSNLDLLAGIDLNSPKNSFIPSESDNSKPLADQHFRSKTVCPPITPITKPNCAEKTKLFSIGVDQLKQETERLESFVAGLTVKTLQGTVLLDSLWKDATNSIEKSGKKLSVSVGRCYPQKNRAPDILPYDQSRVELKQSKDDYVNASFVRGLSEHSPDFVVTQLPLKGSLTDLLELVWQEGIETMVSLVPVLDMGEGNYVPVGKDPVVSGDFAVTLRSNKEMSGFRERVLNINNAKTKQSRALLHLELTCWIGPDLPTAPGQFLLAAGHLLELVAQQRSQAKPVLVHCRDGGSKSGTLCALVASLAQFEKTGAVPDLVSIFSGLLQSRKGIVRDKQYLRLTYETVLYYLQSKLIQEGVISGVAGSVKSHSRHPSQDFISQSFSLENRKSSLSGLMKDDIGEVEEVVQTEPAKPPITDDHEGLKLAQEDKNSAKEESRESVLEVAYLTPDNSVLEVDSSRPPSGLGPPAAESSSLGPPSAANSGLSDLQLGNICLSDSPKKKRITKEDFLNPSGQLQTNSDPSDPLSQLNPLWSLK